MKQLPEHIAAQIQRLIDDGLPADQIAFMMRVDRAIVEEAITATKKQPAQRAG